jgi:hypothetical protein
MDFTHFVIIVTDADGAQYRRRYDGGRPEAVARVQNIAAQGFLEESSERGTFLPPRSIARITYSLYRSPKEAADG